MAYLTTSGAVAYIAASSVSKAGAGDAGDSGAAPLPTDGFAWIDLDSGSSIGLSSREDRSRPG